MTDNGKSLDKNNTQLSDGEGKLTLELAGFVEKALEIQREMDSIDNHSARWFKLRADLADISDEVSWWLKHGKDDNQPG